MGALLGILGFGVGASLGIGAVGAVSGGLRPLLRGAVKAGIAVTETVQSVAASACETIAETAAEARQEMHPAEQEARRPKAPRTRRRPEQTQRIEIATE